ncbi:MAG: LacI family DNA-binding transcriptional regulator [Nakamurella sp.]
MTVTLREVAEVAGVSIATVSRALADVGSVAAETRQRVRRVAKTLGYQPNQAARQLVTGRGQAIGLIIPDLQNPFYASVAKGIQYRARAAGLHAIIVDTDDNADNERFAIAQLLSVVDRLILASPRIGEGEIQQLAEHHSVVLINREVPAVSSVVGDNRSGIEQSLSHLTALGHQAIGYAGGPKTSWSNTDRRTALGTFDFPTSTHLIDLGSYRISKAGGVAAADAGIAAGVTAIMAFNDQLALGILGRLTERGIRVPQDVSVVGFDDIPVARLLAPSLTTVAVPMTRIGETAAGLLINGKALSAPKSTVLDVELQVRSSTAPQ